MSHVTIANLVRRLGALTLLVVGGVHLQEYRDGYAEIETIGPLFLLNFLSATVLAIGLLLPTERWIRRHGDVVVGLLALGGVLLSATSFVMLMIAERRPLFGFMEPGFHPDMIMLSRVSEIATVVLLGGFLLHLAVGYVRPRTPEEAVVRSVALPGLLAAAALLLAACGDDGGDSDAATVAADAGTTVAVADVDGNDVLVESDGAALYTSDEEKAADGQVLCVSEGCLAFWVPLTIDSGTPTGDVDGTLGVVERPDGDTQVTLDGVPLYTFSDDSAGEINGDGLADTFDGQTLTWHVVTASGAGVSETPPPDDGYDY